MPQKSDQSYNLQLTELKKWLTVTCKPLLCGECKLFY